VADFERDDGRFAAKRVADFTETSGSKTKNFHDK